MPNYSYECETKHVTHLSRKAVDRDVEVACKECQKPTKRLLAKTAEPSVMETMDQYRNVKQRQNTDARIRKRAKDHFLENEMPELIAKHGVKQARKMGWIKPDGKVVTKEDMK